MEPRSGKSVVALGVMELLSAAGRAARVLPADRALGRARSRRWSSSAAATGSTRTTRCTRSPRTRRARSTAYDELRKRVVEAYKALEPRCDFVVCEGTDFVGAAAALDFGLNADLANELGAPVLVVVRGGSAEETVGVGRAARDALSHKGCTIFGVVVNRVAGARRREVTARLVAEDGDEPVYVVPERRRARLPDRRRDRGGARTRRSSSTPASASSARCATCASRR